MPAESKYAGLIKVSQDLKDYTNRYQNRMIAIRRWSERVA